MHYEKHQAGPPGGTGFGREEVGQVVRRSP